MLESMPSPRGPSMNGINYLPVVYLLRGFAKKEKFQKSEFTSEVHV